MEPNVASNAYSEKWHKTLTHSRWMTKQ